MALEAILARIGDVIGADMEVVHDRPPRPPAPEQRNEFRQ